jgi:hypothetical protein
MKLCCTSNDCGTLKSRVPKLGLIVLGPLSGRQNFANGPQVLSADLGSTFLSFPF